MRNLFRITLLMMAACLWAVAPAGAEDDGASSAKEYQVKAAFIYNFIKFVEWPGAQALSQTHVANICVVGENPFGSALNLFRQASSTQLALNVKLNVGEGDIAGCHILFIPRSEEGRLSSLLSLAHRYPVLTVSEIGGFADNGGVIEMVKVEKNIGLFSKDKINLRINVKQAGTVGLRIDAQLLEIAAEVIR